MSVTIRPYKTGGWEVDIHVILPNGTRARSRTRKHTSDTNHAMTARGQLPGVIRIGRRVLVRADELVDWLDQKRTPSLEE